MANEAAHQKIAIGWDVLLLNPGLIRPCDVGFQRSTSDISKGIRWGSTHEGEAETFASHTFMVMYPGVQNPMRPGRDVRFPEIIEAQATVRLNPLTDYRNEFSDTVIMRVPGLTEEDEYRIRLAALNYLGDRYPYGKIALHLADKLRGRKGAWRLGITPNLYCNALVERAFADADIPIATWDADEGSPDDLMDRFVRNDYPVVWASSERALDLVKRIYPKVAA